MVVGDLMGFLNLSAKVLPDFHSIFFFTVLPATLISVDDPTFLEDGFFVLRMYQEVLDGTASFEMHFNVMFPVDVLAALTHSLNMGQHHYVGIIVIEACVVPLILGERTFSFTPDEAIVDDMLKKLVTVPIIYSVY